MHEFFWKTVISLEIDRQGSQSIAISNSTIRFKDEARFGHQNTTTRLWARRFTRPRAIRQQQCEYVYFFRAACPQIEQTEAIVVRYLNKNIVSQHLSQIAERMKPGRHAVVVMVSIRQTLRMSLPT
ncbi:hypothetical protein Shal_2015 [Shewanella halifaxensis HAW-EB4]|uniref:Uncharacterized protein n=1 Tax=Shewanella halifaxensis (strain HAW-EB4) TaxID=458817 RepID=B0TT15_SHEHH|nr:hypothetical protein Shal_2015 [Shewanella halifaxensis HAW-EB4]